jgi:hypothetical protein
VLIHYGIKCAIRVARNCNFNVVQTIKNKKL